MEPCASYCLELEEDVQEKVKNLALFLMVAEFSSRMRKKKKKEKREKRALCLRKPKV
jgi:hypothetical protein